MKRFLASTWALTRASLLMYVRDKTAMFFSIIFPVLFLLAFGFAFSRDNVDFNVAIFDNARTPASSKFIRALQDTKAIKEDKNVKDLAEAKGKLKAGKLVYIIDIPPNFGTDPSPGNPSSVAGYYDVTRGDYGNAVASLVNNVLDGFNRQYLQLPEPAFKLDHQGVQTQGLRPIDYLLPGLIGFSLLSLGLFGIANGFVGLKASGALRRLFVVPIRKSSFLVAQQVTRLLIALMSVVIMVVLGTVFFSFRMHGSWLLFLLVVALSILLFNTLGFAVAGWAKNENQAAPIANVVFFPMMILSGTFFPREVFPSWLQRVGNYVPLAYVSDGLRDIANNAAGLHQLTRPLLGIVVWLVISFLIAVRVFRWE